MPPRTNLQLSIGLPLRNQAALSNLLQQIYDPKSPNFRQYLTPEQFTAQFGPSETDYQAVIDFAKAHGLTVTGTHPNRLLLDVSGSPSVVEGALHVNLNVYRHPTENRTFFAPDREPTLDLTVPILGISGLNNYSLPHPNVFATPLSNTQNATPNIGSGLGGTYRGSDFRNAYLPGTTLTGTGQAVGLFEFDGYNASDITNYEGQAGLPNVPLTNVLIDGASGTINGSGQDEEVALDIEMAISMAPGLSRVIVYEAPFFDWDSMLNRMATDNAAKQLSCSWSGGTDDAMAEQAFQQMQTQGQTFFCASGDKDAYPSGTLIPFPCDSPSITIVGGTTLTTGTGGAWASETVWNWGVEFAPADDGTGSGGGISAQYPIPYWQSGAATTANQGSTTMRNIPDVALTADNVYVRADNLDFSAGGTSCAAPLWAGVIALANQQAAANGQPPVGFLNPVLYTIGDNSSYTSAFHDITTGNNEWSQSPAAFSAVPGYDLCTGWGTPNGQFISVLLDPVPQIVQPGFSGNNFQFIVNDSRDGQVTVQATLDFQTWTSIGTVPLPGGSGIYIDTSASLFPKRFYRVTGNAGTSVLVGFTRVTVPGHASGGGLVDIANQLNNPGGNTLGVLLPSVPAGTTFTKHAPVTGVFSTATFSGSVWSNPNLTLNPGEGAEIHNLNTAPFVLTFIGYVSSGSQPIILPPGDSGFVSSIFPVSVGLDVLGFPAVQSEDIARQADTVFGLYNATPGGFFGMGLVGWYNLNPFEPQVPTPQVGEAFEFVNPTTAPLTWTQTLPPGVGAGGFDGSGDFQLNINDPTDTQVTVQATQDFQTWISLGTANLTRGVGTFSDTASRSFTHRFYRLMGGGGTILPNRIGFVQVTVPGRRSDGTGGQALIANQLNDLGGNTLAVLLPSSSVPVGTLVGKFSNNSFNYSTNLTAGWSDPNMTLNPGEGAYVQNPTTTPITLTFMGYVPSGLQSTGLAPGWNLVSSIMPVSVGLDVLGLPTAEGETAMRFDIVSQEDMAEDMYASTLDDGLGFIGWYNSDTANQVPTPQVGEALWIWNPTSTTQTWMQTLPPGAGAGGFDSSGHFQVNINDPADTQVTVQATQDFQTWTSLGTVNLTKALGTFSDTASHSFTHRFYRLVGSGGTILPNRIGFVQVTVPGRRSDGTGGMNLIANQLNDLGGNTVGVLLPSSSVPIGTTVGKFGGYSFTYSTNLTAGWSDPDMTLNPGEGAVIQNPNTTSMTLTFSGYVPPTPQSISLAAHSFSLVSSVFPVSAGLDVLGFPGATGDQYEPYDTVSQQPVAQDYYDASGFSGPPGWYNNSTGNPEVPTPQVGQAFYLYDDSSSQETWLQNLPSP